MGRSVSNGPTKGGEGTETEEGEGEQTNLELVLGGHVEVAEGLRERRGRGEGQITSMVGRAPNVLPNRPASNPHGAASKEPNWTSGAEGEEAVLEGRAIFPAQERNSLVKGRVEGGLGARGERGGDQYTVGELDRLAGVRYEIRE